ASKILPDWGLPKYNLGMLYKLSAQKEKATSYFKALIASPKYGALAISNLKDLNESYSVSSSDFITEENLNGFSINEPKETVADKLAIKKPLEGEVVFNNGLVISFEKNKINKLVMNGIESGKTGKGLKINASV